MARNVYNRIVKGGSNSKNVVQTFIAKTVQTSEHCTVESGVQMARAWEQIMFDSLKIYYLKVSRTILRSRIHFETVLPSP